MTALVWLAAVAAATPTSADHRGEHLGDHLVWTSMYDSVDLKRVPLALPLDGVEVVHTWGLEPVFEHGQLVAFDPNLRGAVGMKLQVPLDDGRAAALSVPLVGNGVPQRIEFSGLRYTPGPILDLQPHIGHRRGPGVTQAHRRGLDRRWDGLIGVETGDTLYVLGSGQVAARGLIGEVVPRSAPRLRVALAGVAAFLVALAGLLTGARWLDFAVRREQRESYLRDELGM